MKYCSNCGAQIDEKAVICVKCGVPVASAGTIQQQTNVPSGNSGHGASTASLVLGILGVISAVITLLIAIGIVSYNSSSYYGVYSSYSSEYDLEKLITALFLVAVPGILSLIGLPLGVFCKRGSGAKIAGIVLNIIAISICVIEFIMIMGM